MSQPKRFSHIAIYDVTYRAWDDKEDPKASDDGEFVFYSDYAALAAELEKWREEHNQLVYENKVTFPTRIGVLQKGLADAAAENERLRVDATDAYSLQSFLKWKGMQGEYQEWLDWRAERPSKEGRDAK